MDVAHKLSVNYVPIGTVHPYENNPRMIPASAVDKVADSITAFGWQQPIVVDSNGIIIVGHTRLMAAEKLGLEEVPVAVADHLSDEEAAAYRIMDNRSGAESEFDWPLLAVELGNMGGLDMRLSGLDDWELGFALRGEPVPSDPDQALADMQGNVAPGEPDIVNKLADRFGVPPFSILDARQGYWQVRKQAWLGLGIQSEIGRGGNLLKMSDTVLSGGKASEKKGQTPEYGGAPDNLETVIPSFYRKLRAGKSREEIVNDYLESNKDRLGKVFGTEGNIAGNWTGTSVFDPVLCELAYRWFSPPGGQILDPFAGGSVRGIVAGRLGRRYFGVDLSGPQIKANRQQARQIKTEVTPKWRVGDSRGRDFEKMTKKIPAVDFLFTCPPYGSLEKYSDNPRDLSAMPHREFLKAYREIIHQSWGRLREDRFACVVVGDFRDKARNLRNFVADSIGIFLDAGAKLHNHAILITSGGSLALRAGRTFPKARRLLPSHQNVLVFVKGNPIKATEAIGDVEFGKPEDI